MSISKVNLTSKNLNLLLILQALLETRSVTAAASRLRMAQPNVSRALRLLRDEFDDPLLVRSRQGLVPTKRATELLSPLQRLQPQLEALYARKHFNILEARGSFTIATTDYTEILLAPALSKIVEKEAPNLTLDFRPSGGVLPKEKMESGHCDLTVLVVRESIPPGYFVQELFLDPYVCAARKRHPILNGKLTLERFTEYGHVLLNPQGTGWSLTDSALAKRGKRRRLVLGTPNALSAVAAVANSDLLLTATKRFLNAASEFFPIETFNSLVEIAPISIAQIWHERSHHDPLHAWVRERIKGILRK